MERVAYELHRRVRRTFSLLPGLSFNRRSERIANKVAPLIGPFAAGKNRARSKANKFGPFQLRVTQMESELFFDVIQTGGKLCVVVNSDHQFFKDVLEPLAQGTVGPKEAATTLELILLAYARAEKLLGNKIDKKTLHSLREAWSNALGAFLT